MLVEVVSGEVDYELNELENKKDGSDGQRTYILLESGDCYGRCFKNSSMQGLGIEKISFQVYQIGEEKLFNMDFKVATAEGKMVGLHFPNRIASAVGYVDFFSELENMAAKVGAVGLAVLAKQAGVLASRHQIPPDKSSAYLRCMDGCDDIEFEPFRLLCYLVCTIWADDTPGS